MNYDESLPATNIVKSILENYESDNVETKIQLQKDPNKSYYLGDQEEMKRKAEEVAAQGNSK